MELGYDFDSRLFPNPGNPRNIVRGIPHQRLHMDEFLRRNQILLLNISGKIILHLRPALLGFRNSDLRVLRRQLKQVTVT